MFCHCLWCQSVSSLTFCIQFYRVMHAVCGLHHFWSQQPPTIDSIVKVVQTGSQEAYGGQREGEGQRGNERWSIANSCISTSCPSIDVLLTLGPLPDKWKMNQDLPTSHNKAFGFFFPPRPSIPKTTRKQRCTWCVLQVDCSPIGQVFDKAWIICNSEPVFITSRNPEKLESAKQSQ